MQIQITSGISLIIGYLFYTKIIFPLTKEKIKFLPKNVWINPNEQIYHGHANITIPMSIRPVFSCLYLSILCRFKLRKGLKSKD